jgi:hypothetical protein
MFFSLPSWAVALLVFAVIGTATAAGYVIGRYLREHEAKVREPFGVLQAALLGVVGLLLAFGLSLAVGRYEDRRSATVTEANAIGMTYLRAQLIAEPARTRSLDLLRDYTDQAIAVSKEVPNSPGMRRTTATEGVLQRKLWQLAGRSISAAPQDNAPVSTWTASTKRSTPRPHDSRPSGIEFRARCLRSRSSVPLRRSACLPSTSRCWVAGSSP